MCCWTNLAAPSSKAWQTIIYRFYSPFQDVEGIVEHICRPKKCMNFNTCDRVVKPDFIFLYLLLAYSSYVTQNHTASAIHNPIPPQLQHPPYPLPRTDLGHCVTNVILRNSCHLYPLLNLTQLVKSQLPHPSLVPCPLPPVLSISLHLCLSSANSTPITSPPI